MDIPITDSVTPTASTESVRAEKSPSEPTTEAFADALQANQSPQRPREYATPLTGENESAPTLPPEGTSGKDSKETDLIVETTTIESLETEKPQPASSGNDLPMFDAADDTVTNQDDTIAVQSESVLKTVPDAGQKPQPDPTRSASEAPPTRDTEARGRFPQTHISATTVEAPADAGPDHAPDVEETRQAVPIRVPTAQSKRHKQASKTPYPEPESTTPASHEPTTGRRSIAAQPPDLVTPSISPQDSTKPIADTTEPSQNISRSGPADQTQAEKVEGRPNSPAERLPDHLPASSNTASRHRIELTRADQARFVQRVARAIQAAPHRGGTLRMRLHPPELGSLSLEVTIERGVLSARLEAETQAARMVLLENLPQLKERLTEQGLRIDQFEVDVSKQETGERSPQFQRADTPHSASRRSDGELVEETLPDDRGNAASGRPDLHDGTLNVVI